MKLFSMLTAVALLLPAVAQSQQSFADIAPDQLIKNVSSEVLDIVRKDKDIQTGNSKKVAELVDTKVLPHFNFTHMTQLALGKDWRIANPAQQKALTEEFRILLVRTYSKTLTEYRDETIEFKTPKADGADVIVPTLIIKSKSNKIPLDYFMEKKPDGWKVYDIVVGGISLVVSYREQFAPEVSKNGIDGLIAYLQSKNRGGGAK